MKEAKILSEYVMVVAGQTGMHVMATSEEDARAQIERKMKVRPYAALALRAWIEQGRPVVKAVAG